MSESSQPDHDKRSDRAAEPRPIRFALQINPGPDEIDRLGRDAETAGFDVITVADHIGATMASPMIALARLAGTTDTIGLGTMVINNDMRNPVQLAWEAATLHRLSGGRFELGLGAGHTPHEYDETGIPFDRPAVRKQRLAEAVEIISALLRTGTVDHQGEHYRVDAAKIEPVAEPLPILVGGNGTALLRHAARHADIIGLQGLGRTLEDGHRHTVRFSIDHLESQLAVIADAAGGNRPELNALVQACTITDDRQAELDEMVDRIEGMTFEDASATPYLAIGSVDEIAAQMIAARDTWGISYFTTRTMDMAPVIERVRQLEQREETR
ncbi:MAG: TIGR03621 family F420-dependent LLM class oxidoreductase [Acidimicrobiales bacterium]